MRFSLVSSKGYSSARCCYVDPLPPSNNSSRMTRSDDSASPFSKVESRDPTTATSEANSPRGRRSTNRLTELAAFTVHRLSKSRSRSRGEHLGRTTQTHDGEPSSAATSVRHSGSSAGSSDDDAASPINPRQEEAENAHTAAAAAATAPCRLKFAKLAAYWFCTCFFE